MAIAAIIRRIDFIVAVGDRSDRARSRPRNAALGSQNAAPAKRKSPQETTCSPPPFIAEKTHIDELVDKLRMTLENA